MQNSEKDELQELIELATDFRVALELIETKIMCLLKEK